MMDSTAAMQQMRQNNIRKVANLAVGTINGAITGGLTAGPGGAVAGALAGAANSALNTMGVNRINAPVTTVQSKESSSTPSAQEKAAQLARQHMEAAQEEKRKLLASRQALRDKAIAGRR